MLKRTQLLVGAVCLAALFTVVPVSAQHAFTFLLVEQQAPATFLGAQAWGDLDDDGFFDLVQAGNDDNLSSIGITAHVSYADRFWHRVSGTGVHLPALDYVNEQVGSASRWLSDFDWADFDSDGRHICAECLWSGGK